MSFRRSLGAGAIALLVISGCAGIFPLPPAGPSQSEPASLATHSHPVTLSGKLYTAGNHLLTAPATVRVLSVTPGNPFDVSIHTTDGSYSVPSVPTALQIRVIVTSGTYKKARLETLLDDAPVSVTYNFGGPDTAQDPPGSWYNVDGVWCSADPDEDVYSVSDIPIFQASEIPSSPTPTPTTSSSASPSPKPSAQAGSSDIPVFQASEIPVFHASEIPMVQASTIQACQAHPVRLVKPVGLDPTPVQAPLDAQLVGSWAISIPQTSGKDLGTLTLKADGSYQWGATSGKAQQVMPHNNAKPNHSYWRLLSGGGLSYYLMLTDAQSLTLYVPGTNLYGGSGARVQ